MKKGNDCYREKRYEEAVFHLIEAANLCPKTHNDLLSDIYYNTAAAKKMLKQWQQAYEYCNLAVHLKQNHINARLLRAKIADRLSGDYLKQALFDICYLQLSQKQMDTATNELKGRVLVRISKAKVDEYFKSCEQKSLPSAYYIKRFFANFTRHPLINSAIDDDKLTKIIDDANSSKDFNKPEVLLMKATLEVLKNNFFNALTLLRKITEDLKCDTDLTVNALILTGTIKAMQWFIEADSNLTNLKNALIFFDKAIELDNKNADIYFHRSQCFAISTQFDKAVVDLKKCCSLVPNNPSFVAELLRYSFNAAKQLKDDEAKEDVITELKHAYCKYPKSADILEVYGVILIQQHDYETADEIFELAIKLDKNNADLYVHRGKWCATEKEEKLKLFHQALEYDDKCYVAYESLALFELENNNHDKALMYFDKALECSCTVIDCQQAFYWREAAIANRAASELFVVECIRAKTTPTQL
ncbi:mitochondrial import receptor subunit TOM70-like protein [Leptotrombidium deliense]|uniref:Mitochondrial import receptor subunit TOM70-like protein n=1 Tax=Leptotrombidium deliense TaxID=299467 RepID=A0A443SGQ3_9ACAR|nr:mitochondrial import receptor subunit TOM70-like protein [Leptotrombidium deliense]